MINCRDVSATGMKVFTGLHKNFFTWFILLCLIGVQILACFTWVGRPVFETKKVDDRSFMITVAAASSVLLANMLLKTIPESLVSKIPVLDETKAMGADTAIM